MTISAPTFSSSNLKQILLLLLALIPTACTIVVHDDDPRTLDADRQLQLDAFIEDALERYGVPGTAVAVVEDGQVVYQRGFGVRDLVDRSPVTTSTIFGLASLSKPLTTTMMASLAEDRILDWDAPVVDAIPGFALSDPESTPLIRVRDLVNHSSGVPEYHAPMFLTESTPTEMIASLREIPTVAPPGQSYNYSNQMFATGGFVAAALAGASYDDPAIRQRYARLMRERVFRPIGMKRTTVDFAEAIAEPDHASPHRWDPQTGANAVTPISFERATQQEGPAGGLWSDVAGMARYIATQFDGLAPDGTRVVSAARLNETKRPAIEMEPGKSYALGWEVHDNYLGMKSWYHNGNTPGFTTSLRLLPEKRIGVVVLTNVGYVDGFQDAVERFVLETMLRRRHADDAEALAKVTTVRGWVRDFVAPMVPVERAEAERYVGRYTHEIRVSFAKSGLQLETAFGAYPFTSTGMPSELAAGGTLTGLFVCDVREDDGGETRLIFRRPFDDASESGYYELERIGD